VPAGSGWPSTCESSVTWNVVAELAPVRHTAFQGTSPPQILRPFTPGRL